MINDTLHNYSPLHGYKSINKYKKEKVQNTLTIAS